MSVHQHLHISAFSTWVGCFRMTKLCWVSILYFRLTPISLVLVITLASTRPIRFRPFVAISKHQLQSISASRIWPSLLWIELKLPVSSSNSPISTIMHLSIRPYALPGQGDGMKKKKRRGRSGELQCLRNIYRVNLADGQIPFLI